jgi:hypothetical protein
MNILFRAPGNHEIIRAAIIGIMVAVVFVMAI